MSEPTMLEVLAEVEQAIEDTSRTISLHLSQLIANPEQGPLTTVEIEAHIRNQVLPVIRRLLDAASEAGFNEALERFDNNYPAAQEATSTIRLMFHGNGALARLLDAKDAEAQEAFEIAKKQMVLALDGRVKAEAEIAALKESARLERTAALREAARAIVTASYAQYDVHAKLVLSLIPAADQSALDAHDAKIRDELILRHRCGCEVCAHTSQLCPASASSLAMEETALDVLIRKRVAEALRQ